MNTTTIITDDNGLRHRHCPDASCFRCEDPGKPFHSVSSCQKNTLLPRIPAWPVHGMAPQYIAKAGGLEPVDVWPGDVYARHLYDRVWEVAEAALLPHQARNCPWRATRIYLIARQNPAEDA